MPGPSIPWKTLETEAWRTQIDSVPPARYKLASPRTITGSPSFAMGSADQHCVVRVYIGAGEAPDLSLTVSGTTPVPMTNAVGGNLTAQELADLRIEVGMPQPGFTLLTTDEPNGSPSAPFTTEAERTAWATANLASLLPGRTTVWGPGNVEYVWNGPLATDWQGIRGPYLGSPENPFPGAAALPAAGRFVGDETCMTYSLAPLGYVRWYWSGARWKLSSDQVIVNYENDDGSPIFDQTATLLTPGTAYDIWMSDILPTWLLTAGFRGALALEAAFSDASSTLNVTMRATLGDALISGTDANNGLVGITSSASASPKEFSMSPVNFRVQSGGIFAVAGSSPFGQGQPGPRDQAQTVLSPRIRLNIVPGAVTNRFRIWSVTLKTGPC